MIEPLFAVPSLQPLLTPEPYDLGRLSTPRPFFGGLAPDVAVGYTVPTLLAAVAVRRGQPLGPTNDQELEDFIYDALELLTGTSDVEVRVDGGRVTLTGLVPHKRVKRDIGELVWGIPIVNDVQNTVAIATRRRSRAQREPEAQQTAGRKQA